MSFLTKDQIISVEDLAHEDVEVPQWGGTVRVRAMTAIERDRFEQETYSGTSKENYDNMRARLVVKCLIDEQGNRLFKDEDAETLGKKHGAIVDKLFWIARRLSAVTDKQIDNLIKNSEPSPSAAGSGESA